MTWTSLDTWIVVVGALCAMACALPGCFLVLRKLSLMGDAISHAVLPGLAIAFLVTGSRDALPMFAGAVVVGILTALLVQGLNRLGRLEEGASMGVVFTTLFAVGLVLIRHAADRVDLDPGCVLYGAIELTVLDMRRFGPWEVPAAAIGVGAVLLANIAFVVLAYKELKAAAFDPEFAAARGLRPGAMHYALMVLVAVTCVATFESVGSILVVAMMIVPGATAWLLAGRLSTMLAIAMLVAVASAVLGHAAAVMVPAAFGLPSTSTAGMIAGTSGLLFALALLFSPRFGIVVRHFQQAAIARRVRDEDLLATIYRREEEPTRDVPTQLDAAQVAAATSALRRHGMIEGPDMSPRLTGKGREEARSLVRSHRLWETYLVGEAVVGEDHVHVSAEQLEHVTGSELQTRLATESGSPTRDPHAREIPK